ncbi:LytR C-terminal domain-containing protein [Gordonia defluvii]|jgi:hypothetical protein|uniref:LytR C-terminal domain-containing protein n=1 Tax=Gordonia defluvii TaxID=283718 RepID=A0ABP6L2X9_9ACTN|nr:LytR C-terminal domain-containing protein [Gordonia sp. UBA5067]
MTTERDTNRLPLRAGAMLLLAVAIVFFGLGAHRLATGSTNQAGPVAAPSAPRPSGATPPSEAVADTSVAASSTKVCVVNAGSVSGLAGSVTEQLKTKGYKTAEPANMLSSTLNENTIFYRPGTEVAAKQVATDLGGGYSVEPRPSNSLKLPACADGVLVIAITE